MKEELLTANAATFGDVEMDQENLERIHREFTCTHEYFELNWPTAFLDHTYFSENVHPQEAKMLLRPNVRIYGVYLNLEFICH
ncbi:hypothetical protein M0804_004306 [Polistes exclamans]|nr:hypothetical protein M0804_004306 [Polistes exclamans]